MMLGPTRSDFGVIYREINIMVIISKSTIIHWFNNSDIYSFVQKNALLMGGESKGGESGAELQASCIFTPYIFSHTEPNPKDG